MHRPRTSEDRIANALDCKLAGWQLITVLACSLLYMGWLFGISADPTAGEKPTSSDDGKPAAEIAADQPKKPDQAKPGQEKPIRGPSWPISRETTYFTEPLDKDGYVNYFAAWNAHFRKGVQPDKNAYVRLVQAFGPRPGTKDRLPDEFFRQLGIKPLPDQGEYFVSYGAFIREKVQPQQDGEWEQHYANLRQARWRPWKQQDFPLIAQWLQANQRPLQIIAEATQRPQWFRPIVNPESNGQHFFILAVVNNLQEIPLLREAAQAYLARSMWHCARGQTEQAWQDILTVLRLARIVGKDPMLISTLVSVALEDLAYRSIVRYLEATHPDIKTLRSHYHDLQNLPSRRPLAEIMDQGERVIALDAVQFFYRHGFFFLSEPRRPGVLAALEHRLMQRILPWKKMLVMVNQYYDSLALAANEPDRNRRNQAYESLSRQLHKAMEKATALNLGDVPVVLLKPGEKLGQRNVYMLLSLMSPAFERMQLSLDRCEQTGYLVQIALALEMYRAEMGQYPTKLEELSPKYIPAVPKDIFSGQLPIYRRTERGYVLYSVGPNGQDDGGRTSDDQPRGDDLLIQIPTALPDKAKPETKPEPPEKIDF
jgi:hypothetical protein